MKISDDIQIDFHHDVKEKKTSCVLMHGNIQTVAIAKCSHNDSFARPIGRKLSLARVMKKSNLNREERTKVWSVLKDRRVNLAF